jgi:HPt (histidine-containing phosphotransfer) domain-containing protein
MQVHQPFSEPAVNIDELLARVDNDHELLRELVVLFKDDFPRQMSALQRAIAESDLKTTERASHTLKGMFLLLAAARAVAAAAQLEQLGRAQDAAALPSALKLLEDEAALLIPELEAYLAKIES